MKRIAFISLIAVFLTANYAYATFPIEELAQKMEQAQYQELTQEELEELFITFITSVDWENMESFTVDPIYLEELQQIDPNQSFLCGYVALIRDCEEWKQNAQSTFYRRSLGQNYKNGKLV